MAVTNGNGKAGRADRGEFTDERVIARILEMRAQGYSFCGSAGEAAIDRIIARAHQRYA